MSPSKTALAPYSVPLMSSVPPVKTRGCDDHTDRRVAAGRVDGDGVTTPHLLALPPVVQGARLAVVEQVRTGRARRCSGTWSVEVVAGR